MPSQLVNRTAVDMKKEQQTKKKRVYYEDSKAQHTTHWDLDYLSQAELEALYKKNRKAGRPAHNILHWIHRIFKRG
jgi:transposase